ncbi:DUF899 domain-containing protein [Kibdelosporangium lantanae]
MNLPPVVSRDEWQAARAELLVKEKEATRARDRLNADRRRLPMVEVTKEYVFEGPAGEVTLPDLFEDRLQLVVYHFMFSPEWDAGCRSCSAFLDQIGHLAHLNARGTTFAAVSLAPYAQIAPFKQRMGWTVPWYSSAGSDFNVDYEATRDDGEYPGISAFLRHDGRVFHTYSTYARGMDGVGSTTSLLDLTALGRQEDWEEPKGRTTGLGAAAGSPQLRYHDEY